jgi:EAL domain-containing protein (putative c-di-GMP-specific phosphodiesterase class I)
VPGQPADLAILRAVRDLGRAMQLRLVAEGVETPAQQALLAELGFDEAQGYLFGGPMPLDMLLAQDAAGTPIALPQSGAAAARLGIA